MGRSTAYGLPKDATVWYAFGGLREYLTLFFVVANHEKYKCILYRDRSLINSNRPVV